MSQRRHFAYVAAGVVAAIALVAGLRIWWRMEIPVPGAAPPVETAEPETAAPTVEIAPPAGETPSPRVESAPRAETSPALAISGCVRDTFGNPIPGAVVACAGEDGMESRSDREGRYRIEVLPSRIFAVTATHPAYFPEQKAPVPAGTEHADFALPLRARLEIQVVRSDTQGPLVCYFINFRHTTEVRHSTARGDGRGGGFGAKVEDPAGKAAIPDLEPVAGVLRIWQEGYVEQEIAVSAEELANTPHNVAIALEPSLDGLEGIVVDTRGQPIPGAYILENRMSWAGDVPQKAETYTGPDGRFRIGPTREPKQDIIAWHPEYAPGYATIYPGTPPHQLLRIVLQGMAAVRGRVTLDGEPLEKCQVVAFYKGERALDENGKHTDADGTYELTGLPPGLAQVQARVDASAWGGSGVDIARTAELVAGEVTLVDFELQRPTGMLEGRIVMASGAVEDAGVRLELETEQGSVRYEASVEDAEDGDGGVAFYRIENVLAGKGILYVAAGDESELFFRITRHEVTMPPGGHVVRDITLSANCGVTGRVTNRESCDIVGVVVLEGESSLTAYDVVSGFMEEEDLESVPIAALTIVSGGIFGSGKENPTGEYAVQTLDPGRHTVLAIGIEKDTFTSDRAFVTLRTGETETVDLALRE